MTVEQLISHWAALATPDPGRKSGSVSIRGYDLYSYALKIATYIPKKAVALILPHGTSTGTTNKHVSMASREAHVAMHIHTVFRVPVLNLQAPENITYFLDEIEAYRKSILNKRCRYHARVHACEHYCEAVRELRSYLQEAQYKGKVVVPDMDVLGIIEDAGDLEFLGQLGLEGDACRIHALDEQ